jgi:signal transduction histidine kinase
VVDTIDTAKYSRERRVSTVRVLAAGCLLAAAIVAAGAIAEHVRFGRDGAAAESLLRNSVQVDFAQMTAEVRSLARAAAADPDVASSMHEASDDEPGEPHLFDAASRTQQRAPDPSLVAVTIYDIRGTARAWAGRPSDLPSDKTRSAGIVFVAPSPLGLRLVCLEPIVGSAPERARLGAVAVEYVLTPAPPPSMLLTAPSYVMPRDRAPVFLHLHGGTAQPGAFVLAAPDGTPLLDASVRQSDLSAARSQLRHGTAAFALAALAVTLLLLAGPLLDRRARASSARRELWLTLAIVAVTLAGAGVFAIAVVIGRSVLAGTSSSRTLDAGLTLLLTGAVASAILAALVPALMRLRAGMRTRRLPPQAYPFAFAAMQLVCGLLLASVFTGFAWFVGAQIDPTAVDLRHFSLHPWSVARLTTLYGVLFTHAAAMWAGALLGALALVWWRLPRQLSVWHVAAAALWLIPVIGAAAAASARHWDLPPLALVIDALASVIAALIAPQLVRRYRHATIASRILALFMAFLLPALLIYPTIHFFDERSIRDLIETRYAAEAMNRVPELQARIQEAEGEIDALPHLPSLVSGAAVAMRNDMAFRIWSQTVLAREHLTSDIELYAPDGRLISRFALNFPEYTGGGPLETSAGCSWGEPVGEAQPFGAQERNTLRAQRSICENGRTYGVIVVHVVFDYRTLPFINTPSAYFDVFSPSSASNHLEGLPAGDVEFAVYGWGLTAIYMSGQSAWPLNDRTFDRIYRSRQPFWTTLAKDDTTYNVYFANDRLYIYALGYPVAGLFEHLVRLAELTTLAAVGYALLLIGTAVFARLVRTGPQTGRALLREIRASFYRKLFLAFVLASIVPVLTLAFVIRAYFANLLLSDIQDEASRTAAVARRVIEESDALLRRTPEPAAAFPDDVMVWVSQLINQDVNVFDGPELTATSERDLFASGLLPTRTPDAVYRAIVLQHLPSYVTEDSIGAIPYMLAATPVRTGGRNAVLTVPLAFRQQEVEREIDDLDRGVQLAALFFILLGAGIGLSMAERIADPVSQLTRATGRIAGGDFDARIAVKSTDELRRLVDAFNGMAAELKAQRDQLERTHRLEAWAEMARQVAHEIKNPLTPIQLSAEHLRRVHADRGEPLGPVLDGCVSSILGQVHLLRQIAAEFSSFASSPTAKRTPVDAVQLVRDVVDPYRAGLAGRIELDNTVVPPLALVLVDRTLVSRALANIIENALHAMPGKGRLSITARQEPGVVVIQVEDTGVGMDEEALERVFEPYFSTKTTGTGLGLPIARRNIELSGGSVSVTSVKDRGTAVTIRLPVASEAT